MAAQPASAAATGGSGASLPYAEVQAENSATNGTVIGPSVAAEAKVTTGSAANPGRGFCPSGKIS